MTKILLLNRAKDWTFYLHLETHPRKNVEAHQKSGKGGQKTKKATVFPENRVWSARRTQAENSPCGQRQRDKKQNMKATRRSDRNSAQNLLGGGLKVSKETNDQQMRNPKTNPIPYEHTEDSVHRSFTTSWEIGNGKRKLQRTNKHRKAPKGKPQLKTWDKWADKKEHLESYKHIERRKCEIPKLLRVNRAIR